MKTRDGVAVLVVEDDPDPLDLITTILEYCGARVRGATSADHALGLFDARPPAIVVSDISMPGRDGYGLVREIRVRQRRLGRPVAAVAVTAFREEHHRSRCLAAGFHEYLTKPIDPDRLCDTVGRVAKTAS